MAAHYGKEAARLHGYERRVKPSISFGSRYGDYFDRHFFSDLVGNLKRQTANLSQLKGNARLGLELALFCVMQYLQLLWRGARRGASFRGHAPIWMCQMSPQDEMRNGTLSREMMPVLISVLIMAIAAWMLTKTFLDARMLGVSGNAGSQQAVEAYGREKDVLLLVLGFLGTIVGYYFGRGPSEKAADKAESRADAAVKEREQAILSNVNAENRAAEVTKANQRNKEHVKRVLASVSQRRTDNKSPVMMDGSNTPEDADLIKSLTGLLDTWEG